MNLFNKSHSKGSGLWNGIKKVIDDIISEIEQNLVPKLKPIKIKNSENKNSTIGKKNKSD